LPPSPYHPSNRLDERVKQKLENKESIMKAVRKIANLLTEGNSDLYQTSEQKP
jgi:hypothetical protein